MKKVINIVKNNKLVLLAFIIGLIISSVGVYYGATLFSSDQVIYSGTKTLKDSLDELNSKIGVFDYATASASSDGKIFASKKGVCISRNQIVHCFKTNNYDYEKDHIQQVFSDVSCTVDSSVFCRASDFTCNVYSDGYVICHDSKIKCPYNALNHTDCSGSSGSGFFYCQVESNGSAVCG